MLGRKSYGHGVDAVALLGLLCVRRGGQGERHTAMVVCLFVSLGSFRGPLNVGGLAGFEDEQARLSAVRQNQVVDATIGQGGVIDIAHSL